jgi:hypothetical protein
MARGTKILLIFSGTADTLPRCSPAKVDLSQCIWTPLDDPEEKATAPTINAK